MLTRYTQPEPELRLLVRQLKLQLPPQPPPRIATASVPNHAVVQTSPANLFIDNGRGIENTPIREDGLTTMSGMVAGTGANIACSAGTSMTPPPAAPGPAICSVIAVASPASQPRSCASARSATIDLQAVRGSTLVNSFSQARR